MSRIIRVGIVLGLAVATIGVSAAVAAELQSDAFERAAASKPTVPTDAFDRAVANQSVLTDAHERGSVGTPTTTPIVEATGWTVNGADVVLAAAIAVGIALASVLLVGAVRRHPPHGQPPLAHR